MIFAARLRNRRTGEIYPAMYCTPSFEAAEKDAEKAFPLHDVLDVYPQLLEDRARWAMRNAVTVCANWSCGAPIHKGDSVYKAGGRLYCNLNCALDSVKVVRGV